MATTYAAVGHAITEWEKAEEAMARLFSFLLGVAGDYALPAMRAYGAVKTCAGRIEMVAAASEAFFFQHPEPNPDNRTVEKEVSAALVAMKEFSSRRNEIAHGQVHEIEIEDGFMRSPSGHLIKKMKSNGFVVGPSYYSTSKTDLAPGATLLHPVGRTAKYSYSATEIDTMAAGFVQLEKDINFATAAVNEHLNPPRRTS